MKNILYITNTLEIGGAEVQLKNLLKYIDRSSFDPFVCVLKKSGPIEKEIRNLDIPIFVIRKSGLNFTILFNLLKIIKENKIDIIHSALFASNFWGRIAGILTKKKIIASERSAYKKPLRIIFDKILAHFTDKIICNSEAVKKFQIQKEKITPEKLEVIYNGVDIEEFDRKLAEAKSEKNNYFTIGNMCRITPEKNLITWIETAKILSEKNNTLRFIISGNATTTKQKDYKNKITNLIEKYGLGNKITITDGQDVAKTFSAIHLFFQSSDIEGFPNTVMEAMTAQLPVVATPAGGTEELITDNKNGIILMGKPENMAKQILWLVNNPAKMKMISNNARTIIENNFSAEKLARRTENIYRQLSPENNTK